MNEAALIQSMKLVEEISTSLHTTSWVWGGLTMDIYQGCLLRDHHDVDYLTLHLHDLKEPLTGAFLTNGCQAWRLDNGDLKLKKEDIEIQLGHITFSNEVRWTHNGELGSLFFPLEWLNQQSRRFCEIDLHVVAPEFQYIILFHPTLLNSKWIPREKDVTSMASLKSILEAKGVAVAGLETRMHT